MDTGERGNPGAFGNHKPSHLQLGILIIYPCVFRARTSRGRSTWPPSTEQGHNATFSEG